MGKLEKAKLSEIHASLALAVDRLGDASATLASGAAPLLGAPPARAPPAAMPLAHTLSKHAAAVALSAPVLAKTVPTLSSATRL